MKFKNPTNGHVEEVLGNFHWLWVFLWTPIYYAVKGVWTHAVISFVVGWVIGGTIGLGLLFIPSFLISLIYAIMNKSIVRNHYLRQGWVLVDE